MTEEDKLFIVIDTETGKEADMTDIAEQIRQAGRGEHWAWDLISCDIDGWIIDEYGCLGLCDDTGQTRYPPSGMYEVRPTMKAWRDWADRCGGEWKQEDNDDKT